MYPTTTTPQGHFRAPYGFRHLHQMYHLKSAIPPTPKQNMIQAWQQQQEPQQQPKQQDMIMGHGGYGYAFQQQPNTIMQTNVGMEPEVQEASASYMSEINRLESKMPGAPKPGEKRLEDEAMASYIPELNQRMGSLNTLASQALDDSDNSQFLITSHQSNLLSPKQAMLQHYPWQQGTQPQQQIMRQQYAPPPPSMMMPPQRMTPNKFNQSVRGSNLYRITQYL